MKTFSEFIKEHHSLEDCIMPTCMDFEEWCEDNNIYYNDITEETHYNYIIHMFRDKQNRLYNDGMNTHKFYQYFVCESLSKSYSPWKLYKAIEGEWPKYVKKM